MKTCFISAPAGAPLDVLRAALESRGLRVLVPQELAVGSDWASEIQKELSRADLVVGVLTSERESPWVLFELGQAWALHRRIVLITAPTVEPIPFVLHQFLVLRIELDNAEAIGFALDQVLSAPQKATASSATSKGLPAGGLGAKIDELLARLEVALTAGDGRAVEQVVADTLRASGTDIVVSSPTRDVGADFAVWSDVLEPFVGNPLLIEVKTRIRDQSDSRRVFQQVSSFLGTSGARWGLVLYGEGPGPESSAWTKTPPNVLVVSLRVLLHELRTRAFPEVVRDLRNKRVHGSAS
jgi:hypothetical protein